MMSGKRAGAGLVIAGAAAVVYFRLLRPWHLHWGATAQEAGGEVAGDELMPDPDIVATRVVEIDAPPSAIWPWHAPGSPGLFADPARPHLAAWPAAVGGMIFVVRTVTAPLPGLRLAGL